MSEVYKIFGPPGTGKTTKMLNLLEQEMEQGIKPKEIAYMSFTRVAVGEAKKRALVKFPELDENRDLGYFRTMHSMAYRVLNLRPDRVVNGEPLFDFGEKSGYPFDKTKKFTDPDEIMFGDSAAGEVSLGSYLLGVWDFIRNNLWGLDEGIRKYPQMIFHPALGAGQPDLIFRDFVNKYEAFKSESGLLDFTDFLMRVLAFNQPLYPPVRTIFFDECQDSSPLQWKVLRVWARAYNDEEPVRLFLAGDDDQAIFAFQGAAPHLFLDYPGIEKVLSRTWRLPRAIWEYSQQMIQRNHDRRAKEFTYNAEGGSGSVERIRSFYEISSRLKASARGDDGSWFLLVRNRYLLEKIAIQLEKDFIPYSNRRGWSPFDNQKLVRACEIATRFQTELVTLAELFALVGDYVESQRVDPETGNRQTMVVRGGKKHLEDKARTQPNSVISRYEAAKVFGLTQDFYDLLDLNPVAVVKFKSLAHKEYVSNSFSAFGPAIFKSAARIELSTIHGTKGDEADNVVLISDVSNSCYKNMHADPEGERRVFYVGCTRAKQNLFLVSPLTNKFYPL